MKDWAKLLIPILLLETVDLAYDIYRAEFPTCKEQRKKQCQD